MREEPLFLRIPPELKRRLEKKAGKQTLNKFLRPILEAAAKLPVDWYLLL